jgi:hypothetical protein
VRARVSHIAACLRADASAPFQYAAAAYLVGPLAAGFTTSKLFAWSATFGEYYAASQLGTASYGATNYGSGVLRGTSLGLDRPAVSILRDILAALDPSGTSNLTASWKATDVQPCPPWITIQGSNPGQLNTTPVRA